MTRRPPARRSGERPSRRGERSADEGSFVVRHGWRIAAHPLFLDQIVRLAAAAKRERTTDAAAHPGPNTRLLAHIMDLALDAIPRDPGHARFRQGKTLGDGRSHWFRAKTGNGRYRLFYRFDSASRVIVLAWVNDAQSLRTRGSRTDAYRVFASMLEAGHPPDAWEDLLAESATEDASSLLRALTAPQHEPRS